MPVGETQGSRAGHGKAGPGNRGRRHILGEGCADGGVAGNAQRRPRSGRHGVGRRYSRSSEVRGCPHRRKLPGVGARHRNAAGESRGSGDRAGIQSGRRQCGAGALSVNVAIVFVASRVTVPVALTHGAAHVTVMLAVPVNGATGSFSVAVTRVLVNTPVAPLSGITAVTAGTRAAIPLLPRMPSLLQPAANTPSASTITHAPALAATLNDVHAHPRLVI